MKYLGHRRRLNRELKYYERVKLPLVRHTNLYVFGFLILTVIRRHNSPQKTLSRSVLLQSGCTLPNTGQFSNCTTIHKLLFEKQIYREAVATQSPGLLQPWVNLQHEPTPQRGCVLDINVVNSIPDVTFVPFHGILL